MPESPPNPELLRALLRLVRGLSALFWGLPVALIVCVQTAKSESLRTFNVLPPIIVTGWLVYGVWQLGHFQKQERIWVKALDWTKQFGLVQLGLSPFLYWWNQRPDEEFYAAVITLMGVCGLLFLSSLNLALYRLSTMLPDEALRQETRHFTRLNRSLLLGILALAVAFRFLLHYPSLITPALEILMTLGPGVLWLLVFLSLLPLAMTMALLWKIKEVILESVFGAGG